MKRNIETNRLKLRQWQPSDYAPFAKLNSDSEVMKYFPSTLSEEESNALAQRLESTIDLNGWGFWAVEHKSSNQFIGFVGINSPTADLPFKPCIEIGWRLAKPFWRKGYATEAAQESLKFAFSYLNLTEVVSFTPVHNQPSQAVMKKLGMYDAKQNFIHPSVPDGNVLQEHVLFKISKNNDR